MELELAVEDLAPIHRAAWTGDVPELERLLDEDPSLLEALLAQEEALVEVFQHFFKSVGHAPPLVLAVVRGQDAAVQLLLGRGADVWARSIFGNTALH